ncbi:hypothetical protein F8S13_10080 [Chloroflexia bacterium SDU3-3]|nr:hypothetical protein F8S13_10080 [Chloroflexia bacterium SDU3-3]
MAVRSQEMRNAATRASTPSLRPVAVTPSVAPHALAYIVTALLALAAISAIMGNVVTWGRTQVDTLRYGNPRTFQLSEAIGHEDSPANPTHLMAINLNRQVVIIELPGGDSSKVRTLTGPYLFGADEDKTPVLMRLDDLNKDGTRDLVVNIKNEEIVYLNKDGQFQLITAEERSALAQ